jgi:hypothetical protein
MAGINVRRDGINGITFHGRQSIVKQCCIEQQRERRRRRRKSSTFPHVPVGSAPTARLPIYSGERRGWEVFNKAKSGDGFIGQFDRHLLPVDFNCRGGKCFVETDDGNRCIVGTFGKIEDAKGSRREEITIQCWVVRWLGALFRDAGAERMGAKRAPVAGRDGRAGRWGGDARANGGQRWWWQRGQQEGGEECQVVGHSSSAAQVRCGVVVVLVSVSRLGGGGVIAGSCDDGVLWRWVAGVKRLKTTSWSISGACRTW